MQVLLDELCPKNKQTGTGCREWGAESESSRYIFKHRPGVDKNDFILLLPNFQESDVGLYRITCSGRHEKTVNLTGTEQRNLTEFEDGHGIETKAGNISVNINSQETDHQRCIFKAETRCGTCCYESDTKENLCKETVNGEYCRVRPQDCGDGICRSFQVIEEKGSCIIHLRNIDTWDVGRYKVTFVNHGQAVVDVTVRPNSLLIWMIPLFAASFMFWIGIGFIRTKNKNKRITDLSRLGGLGVFLNTVFYFFCISQYWVSFIKELDSEGFGLNCTIALLATVFIIVLRPLIGLIGNKYINGFDFPFWVIILFVIMGPLYLLGKSLSRDKKLRLALLIGVLPQVKLICR